MTICSGVPATTAHNLNSLNNSRQGVMQPSLMEEITKIQVMNHLRCLLQGHGPWPVCGGGGGHRMEGTNRAAPGGPVLASWLQSSKVWVQVTSADTHSCRNKPVMEAWRRREVVARQRSSVHVMVMKQMNASTCALDWLQMGSGAVKRCKFGGRIRAKRRHIWGSTLTHTIHTAVTADSSQR